MRHHKDRFAEPELNAVAILRAVYEALRNSVRFFVDVERDDLSAVGQALGKDRWSSSQDTSRSQAPPLAGSYARSSKAAGLIKAREHRGLCNAWQCSRSSRSTSLSPEVKLSAYSVKAFFISFIIYGTGCPLTEVVLTKDQPAPSRVLSPSWRPRSGLRRRVCRRCSGCAT